MVAYVMYPNVQLDWVWVTKCVTKFTMMTNLLYSHPEEDG